MDFKYLILGLIQGLTEFLPVSSSGHLVLFERWFIEGVSNKSLLMMNVVFHMGTLLSVVLFFHKYILEYVKACFRFLKAPSKKLDQEQDEVLKIIFLSVPTGVLGLLMKKGGIEHVSVGAVLLALSLTGLLCIVIDHLKDNEKNSIGLGQALILGIVQGCAVMPGISRSGSTIFTGVLLGISREKMSSFSFLMSLPAIGGAFLLEMKDVIEAGVSDVHYPSLLAGFFTSFLVGYLSLFVLISLLKKKNFKIFGIYCLVISLWNGWSIWF